MHVGIDRTNWNRRLGDIGPGGLRCPCCTDLPPAEQKRVDRRRQRQALKRDLWSELLMSPPTREAAE